MRALGEVAEDQWVRGLPRIEPGYVVGGEDLLVLGLRDGVVLCEVLVGHESVAIHSLALVQPEVDELLGGPELVRARHQQALEHVADVSDIELTGREGDIRRREEERIVENESRRVK